MDNRFRLYQQTEEVPVSGMKQNCGCVVEDEGCPVLPSQAEADVADTSEPGHWSYIAACWLLPPPC